MTIIDGAEKPSLEDLAHFGVKGMKWGVRKEQDPALAGVPRSTSRDARKDAAEFTKAKMFYGEGAGTRRKLIKATVESKSRRDPAYKKAFDHYTQNTDLAKRAVEARRTRKRKDTGNAVKKTGRGINHVLNGNSQYANVTATLAVGGYMYARKTGIDKVVSNAAKNTYQNIKKNPAAMRNAADFMRKMGI